MSGVWLRNVIPIRACTRTTLRYQIGENFCWSTENFSIYYQFKTTSFWFVIGTLMQQGSDMNPKVNKTVICWTKILSFLIKQIGDKHSYRWRHLVVFHFDNHLELYSKLSSLFDCGTNDNADWKCRRFGDSNRNNLRHTRVRLHNDFLQGNLTSSSINRLMKI